MLKDISCSRSCKHSRNRAKDPGTALEQLITIGRKVGIVQGDKNGRSIKKRLLTTVEASDLLQTMAIGMARPTPVRRNTRGDHEWAAEGDIRPVEGVAA